MLNNLTNALQDASTPQAALEPAQEVADIYRRLADIQPSTYLPHLASSLRSLALLHSQAGPPHAASALAQEAIGILRRQGDASSEADLEDMAKSLMVIAERLTLAGHPEDALPVAQEAAAVFRPLADSSPDPDHLMMLGMSLVPFVRALADTGKARLALDAAEEAVSICQRLSEADPGLAEAEDFAVVASSIDAAIARIGLAQAKRRQALPGLPEQRQAGQRQGKRRAAKRGKRGQRKGGQRRAPAALAQKVADIYGRLAAFVSSARGRRPRDLPPSPG